MRRWIRRVRLAFASLLVLLAVGLLVAWPVTMRHGGIVGLHSGPNWEWWWFCSAASIQGWQVVRLVVCDDDQQVFSPLPYDESNRVELGFGIQHWLRLHVQGFDTSFSRSHDAYWLVPEIEAGQLQKTQGGLPGVTATGSNYSITIHTALLVPVLLLLAFLLAFGPIRRIQKRYRVRSGLCLHCGYHLAGVEGERCPECGADRSMVTFHRGEA